MIAPSGLGTVVKLEEMKTHDWIWRKTLPSGKGKEVSFIWLVFYFLSYVRLFALLFGQSFTVAVVTFK